MWTVEHTVTIGKEIHADVKITNGYFLVHNSLPGGNTGTATKLALRQAMNATRKSKDGGYTNSTRSPLGMPNPPRSFGRRRAIARLSVAVANAFEKKVKCFNARDLAYWQMQVLWVKGGY